MRRWILTLLLLAAAPALAQEDAGQVAPPAPAEVLEAVRTEARYLLAHLLTGDVRGATALMTFPFQLEDRRLDTPEALVATWGRQLRFRRTDLLDLYGVEVLTYADMEQKYGRPPARLGALVPRGTEVYVAVANLSGRAAVVLYRQTPEGWRAFAYTD